MMRLTESLYALLIIDLVASFALSYAGLWYYVFVPSALLGFLLKSSWMNLVYFGLSGAIGAIIPIFLSDTGSRFANASLVGCNHRTSRWIRRSSWDYDNNRVPCVRAGSRRHFIASAWEVI